MGAEMQRRSQKVEYFDKEIVPWIEFYFDEELQSISNRSDLKPNVKILKGEEKGQKVLLTVEAKTPKQHKVGLLAELTSGGLIILFSRVEFLKGGDAPGAHRQALGYRPVKGKRKGLGGEAPSHGNDRDPGFGESGSPL